MAASTEPSSLEHFVALMNAHAVEFIVIGGQAEALHGSARITYDVDFCYRRTTDNLARLAAALRELKPTLRGAPPGLPFRIDAQSLALGSNFTFSTPFGDFDLLGYVEPLGAFEELDRNAETIPFGDSNVRVTSLDDLITIKRHIGRPKDRDSLAHLLAIKRLRDEGAGGGPAV